MIRSFLCIANYDKYTICLGLKVEKFFHFKSRYSPTRQDLTALKPLKNQVLETVCAQELVQFLKLGAGDHDAKVDTTEQSIDFNGSIGFIRQCLLYALAGGKQTMSTTEKIRWIELLLLRYLVLALEILLTPVRKNFRILGQKLELMD
jgi:hypothetical protein